MISRVSGKLLECDPADVVVDVHGLGLSISVPVSTYEKLPRPGADVVLHTHFHVREDGMQLFGFATLEERRLFRLLITTVSGIGPRLALNILSCMTVRSFCQAIAAGDLKALSRVNGIGKRSAERLVVELKERIDEIEPGAALAPDSEQEPAASREVQDALAALETLGFKSDAARKAIRHLCKTMPPAEQSAENLIRKALAALNA